MFSLFVELILKLSFAVSPLSALELMYRLMAHLGSTEMTSSYIMLLCHHINIALYIIALKYTFLILK